MDDLRGVWDSKETSENNAVVEDTLEDIEGVVGHCSALLRRSKEAGTSLPHGQKDIIAKVRIFNVFSAVHICMQ